MKFIKIVWLLLVALIFQFVSAENMTTSITGTDSIPKFNNPVYVVYGDTRSDDAEHRRVIKAIEKINPNYVFHTGDLIRGSNIEDQGYFIRITRLCTENDVCPVVSIRFYELLLVDKTGESQLRIPG